MEMLLTEAAENSGQSQIMLCRTQMPGRKGRFNPDLAAVAVHHDESLKVGYSGDPFLGPTLSHQAMPAAHVGIHQQAGVTSRLVMMLSRLMCSIRWW